MDTEDREVEKGEQTEPKQAHGSRSEDMAESERENGDDESSESGSEESDESDSGSEDESSSSEGEVMLRPMFIGKSKRTNKQSGAGETAGSGVSEAEKRAILSNAERPHAQEDGSADAAYDGVDDVDDVDPEGEYKLWKEREKARRDRDIALVQQHELEEEDRIRRQLQRAGDS